MSNNLTVQLPSHLAVLQKANTALAAMGGIVVGGSFHRISIKQSRWRLNDPQGQEIVVPTLNLDVIIVNANPTQSKLWYKGAYNPAETEFKGPDCYSDNGIGPSARSTLPQSNTCAECPHNVWGSKITPAGSKTKACADVKKLAVILADNPTGPVYELRIPAASLKNLYAFVQSLNDRGIPLPSMVVRLTFDPQADYPRVIFSAQSWATPEQVNAIVEVLDSDEISVVTNKNDKVFSGNITSAGNTVSQPPATVAMPQTQAYIPPAPVHSPANAGFALPPTAAPQENIPPQVAPAKRTRRTKAEIEAANATPQGVIGMGHIAQGPDLQPAPTGFFDKLQSKQDVPNAASPAASVNPHPQPATSALEDLISKAMQA